MSFLVLMSFERMGVALVEASWGQCDFLIIFPDLRIPEFFHSAFTGCRCHVSQDGYSASPLLAIYVLTATLQGDILIILNNLKSS